jgi:hypothetical protein
VQQQQQQQQRQQGVSMGLAGSKDDRGVRVLQALPPGFLDEKGKELRNDLDICLEKNGWYFTIGALPLLAWQVDYTVHRGRTCYAHG